MKKTFALILALVMILTATVVALADPALIFGDSGAQIKKIQKYLKTYHYYTGKITGEFDKATLDAVKDFQKYNHLNVDGKVGEKTLYYLTSGIAVYAPVKDKETANKEDVKKIQTRLQHYGFYTGKIDGIYGTGSVAAVRAFQAANGLKVDGAVGSSTLEKLNASDSKSKSDISTTFVKVKLGSNNEFVKTVQKRLWKLGYYNGDWSGVFGTETWKAVKAFQADHELTVDGSVGTNTWGKLKEEASAPSKKDVEDTASEQLKKYQQQLKDLGWYKGELTGKYDKATVDAVKAFQKATGLKVDGAIGPKTLAKMNGTDVPTQPSYGEEQTAASKPVIYPGVQGSYVKEIQKLLTSKGYYSGKINGKFDQITKNAVVALQQANGLKDDGIVGRDTWKILLK